MHLTFSVEIYDTRDLFFKNILQHFSNNTKNSYTFMMLCFALYLMFSSTTYIVKKCVKYL